MTPTLDNLQQQADNIAQELHAAFPDTPLPAATRLGCGYWTRHADGNIGYVYRGECLEMEVFFRREEHLWGSASKTPQEEQDFLERFFLDPPPAKRWTEVVGAPLLSWLCVTWSRFQMTPRARAYYLPAYLLTALPFLVMFPYEPFVAAPEGQVNPLGFVGDTLDMLLPPTDAIGWDDLADLPPEGFAPSSQPLVASTAEDFLRFAQCLTAPQKRVIQCFVAFALRTYPLYVPPGCCQQEVTLLTRFWLQPSFAG